MTPGRPTPPDGMPAWLRESPLAHRGLHDATVSENSLAAFEAAARAGYGVELDVQLSRDSVPVVAHDPSLARSTGVPARVGELTARQLGRLRLADGHSHVPTLADALEVLARTPVMVELKQFAPCAGPLERRVAEALDAHPGPWCVASFNPVSLRWFRRRRPDAVRVLTASPFVDARLPFALRGRLAGLRDLPSVVPHAVSYQLRALPTPATEAWRAVGGTLVAWTATDEDELARARRLADNLIFEHVRP